MLSDSTLRYELLEAALFSRRFAPLLALNEPEDSFHPDLLAPLGVRGREEPVALRQ